MKKAYVIILAAAMLILAACTGKAGDPLYGKPFDEGRDPAFVFENKTYSINDDAQSIVKALPGEYEYTESLSCMTEGYDKTYDFGYIVIDTVPAETGERISRVTITDGSVSTARGIKVGDGREDLINAYGEAFFEDGPYIVYSKNNDKNELSGIKIYFEIENDNVKEIMIFDPGF